MNLQHVAVSLPGKRKEFRLIQPRRQNRYHKPNWMYNWSQYRQPRVITGKFLLRAIEVELEFVDLHIVRASIIEKLFRNIDNHARRWIICAEWPRKRRNTQRKRTWLGLPVHRFPIN